MLYLKKERNQRKTPERTSLRELLGMVLLNWFDEYPPPPTHPYILVTFRRTWQRDTILASLFDIIELVK